MMQETDNPFGVGHVRLVARQLGDVLRVEQHHSAFSLQDIESRMPVDAPALEGDLSDLLLGEPIAQGEQVSGHRAVAHPLTSALLVLLACVGEHAPATGVADPTEQPLYIYP